MILKDKDIKIKNSSAGEGFKKVDYLANFTAKEDEDTPKLDAYEILERYEKLKNKYQSRNAEFAILRAAYEGRYWEGAETEGITLIYNLLNSGVHRYVDYMSSLPEVRVIPPGNEKEHQEFADKLEKGLYGIWEATKMDIKLQMLAFYQSMLGMFVIFVRPSPKDEAKVSYDVCVPEYFFPKSKASDFTQLEYVIYASPDVTMENKEHPIADTQDITIQYWDLKRCYFLKNDKIIHSFEHKLGCIPWVVGQNRVRPHRVHGSSDLEQAVGLMDYLNNLFSSKADIIAWAADPPQVIKGSSLTPDEIPRGPGSIICLEQEASIAFLQWSGSPPDLDNQINLTQKAIQDMLGLADASFGRGIPSGTSGATIRETTGGTTARIGAKEVLIGRALVDVNAITLRIFEKVYPNEDLIFFGIRRGTPFHLVMKGKEIKGHTRTRVLWGPGQMEYPVRVSMELQKQGAGIQSRITTMENLGIEQPLDEQKRIKDEKAEDIRQRIAEETTMSQLRAKSQPQQINAPGQPNPEEDQSFGTPDEKRILADLLGRSKGGANEGLGLTPDIDPLAELPGQEGKGPILPEDGKPLSANPSIPAGQPSGDGLIDMLGGGVPQGTEPTSSTSLTTRKEVTPKAVTLKEFMSALSGIAKLVGSVWVIGLIAEKGSSETDLGIGLSDLADKSTIINALPQYKGRLKFTKVTGKPKGKSFSVK